MFVITQDARVHPIRQGSLVTRTFPGDSRTRAVERPLGVPTISTIIGVVVARANAATTAIIGVRIGVQVTIIHTHATIFQPRTVHAAMRRDSTVVFVPQH